MIITAYANARNIAFRCIIRINKIIPLNEYHGNYKPRNQGTAEDIGKRLYYVSDNDVHFICKKIQFSALIIARSRGSEIQVLVFTQLTRDNGD